MNLRISVAAAATALCLALVGPVLAQAPSAPPDDPLPEAPGKAVVVRVCTACHDASQFAFARYTPEEWDTEIAKMQGTGAEMTAEEQVAVSAYLAKNLNSKPAAATAPAPPADGKPPL